MEIKTEQEIRTLLNQTMDDKMMAEITKELETRLVAVSETRGFEKDEHWLLLLYLAGKNIRAACALIAEYKIDVWDVMYLIGEYPKALKDRGLDEHQSLSAELYEQMVESDVTYDEFYEMFQVYPSGEYAQILIAYARKEDRRTDVIAMSNFIRRTIQQRDFKANDMTLHMGGYPVKTGTILLAYYADRMGDLAYIKDYGEIRKCINEAKRCYENDSVLLENGSPEWLPRFWINMMHCLNIIGRFDRTIELGETLTLKMTHAEYYLYLAEAYYMQNNLEEACKNARRSAGLEKSQGNLLLLAQICFTERKYTETKKLLWQCISMISDRVEEHYIDDSGFQYGERTVRRKLHDKEIRERLESPYTLLFLCYVYEEDYVKAKAFYEETKEKLGSTDMVMISAALLHVNEMAKGQQEQVEEAKRKMRIQLEQSRKENEQKSQLLKQWTLLLVECQVEDETLDISEDYWDNHVRERMDQAIQKISSIVKKSNVNGYIKKEKEVREWFPKMPDSAIKFMASAEQMYEVFQENPIIDFAPVMVEYCKVIEFLLWDYLDRTGEYDPEIQCNKNQLKTLGTAAWAIKMAGISKTLYPYLDDIERINESRCESAHKEKSREPDVKKVREYIRQGDLIKKLCS